MKTKDNSVKEPLIHITKRSNMSKGKAFLIRVIAFVAAMIVSAVVALLLIEKLQKDPSEIFEFFKCFIDGSFQSTGIIWKFLKNTAILLCIALSITPAFKMKFWNTGAEGQVLVGVLGAIAMAWYIKGAVPNWLLLIIMMTVAMISGAIWAALPGVCKAIWNTNETLFTLMMNYVATFVTSFFLLTWVPTGNALGIVNKETKAGWLPVVIDDYFIIILVSLLMTAFLYVYLNYSKHGYEIAVVGESENTAKYIGINVKKVIVRTTILSGAMCGLTGFLIASGLDHSITTNAVGGQGFTAIMVSWLAQFNPIAMIGTSALVIFLEMGAGEISCAFDVSGAMPEIIVGIILLFIIGSEFFINYKIHFRGESKKKTKNSNEMEGVK